MADQDDTLLKLPAAGEGPRTGQDSNDILQTVSEIKSNILEEIKHLRKMLKESKDENKALVDENKSLALENKRLCLKVAELDSKLNANVWQNHRSGKKDLILGDSIIRDIDQTKLQDTVIHCNRGARIQDTINDLDLVAEKGPFGNITLVTGTNDAADHTADVEGTIEKYKTLINKASGMAEKVSVSSILPRKDQSQERVDLLNVSLASMCTDSGEVDLSKVSFIDNTKSFMLQDGDVNDGYFIGDGPHITYGGSNRLARNLKVKVKPGVQDITRTPKHKTKQHQGERQHQQGNGNRHKGSSKRQQEPQRQHHQGHQTGAKGRTNTQQNAQKMSPNRGHRMPWSLNSSQEERENAYRNDDYTMDYLNDRDYRGRCHYCFEEGHNKGSCRHRAPAQCLRCLGYGHKAKHCY